MDNCLNYKHIKGTERMYENSAPLTTHAYMLTYRGIKKLLSIDYHFTIDMMLRKQCSNGYLKCISIHPSIFFQDTHVISSSIRDEKDALNSIIECGDASIIWISSIGITIIIVIMFLILIIFIIYMNKMNRN